MNLAELTHQLRDVRGSGSGWSARLPAQRDRFNSPSIRNGRYGNIFLYCFAGSSFQEIVAALGLSIEEVNERQGSAHSMTHLEHNEAFLVKEFGTWRNRASRKLNNRHRSLLAVTPAQDYSHVRGNHAWRPTTHSQKGTVR